MAQWYITRLPMQETQEVGVQVLDGEEPLKEEMATYSSILVWEIPWIEETGRLQSMGHKESDTTELLNTHTHASLSNKLLCMQ